MTADAQKLDAALKQISEGFVSAALRKAGANVVLLLPHVSPRICLELVGGRLEPRVVDERGAIRLGTGDAPMTIDALLSEMRSNKDFGLAFSVPVNVQPKSKRRQTL